MENLTCAGIVIIAILFFVYALCRGSLVNKNINKNKNNNNKNKEEFKASYPFKYEKVCDKIRNIIKTGRRPGNSESRVRY